MSKRPTKVKTRGANLPVPQSREDAANAIKEFGEISRKIARIELDASDEAARIKHQAEEDAAPMKDRAAALQDGLKIWAEANCDKLTDGGKVKFADLGTGKISWRFRPPSARIAKVEAAVEMIKKLGFLQFLRVKEEPDREAMKADPEKARLIAGVTIGTEGEDFIVEPFELELSKGAA